MAIDKKLIDQLLTDYKKPEDIIGENGLLKELTKATLERALQAELTDHLGYEKHDPAGHHRGNTRNGKSQKTLQGDFGELELETPRDRQATFDPKIVAKRQTRWTGFDDKIISMYARGMTTREIQGHLQEIYGIEVSPTLISNATEAVLEEVKLWQNRPLEELYPIVYLDEQRISLAPGEDREASFSPLQYSQLVVKNLDLWWPYTMGKPNLYDLRLEFVKGYHISDVAHIRFGIRTITQYRDQDNQFPEVGKGGNFYLQVNGKDFLARGAVYTPDLLYRYDPAREATLIRYVKDLGLNMLRWESKIASEHIVELADTSRVFR